MPKYVYSQTNCGTVRDQLLAKLGPVAYGQLIKNCKTVLVQSKPVKGLS